MSAPSQREQNVSTAFLGQGDVEEGVVLLGKGGQPFDGSRVEHPRGWSVPRHGPTRPDSQYEAKRGKIRHCQRARLRGPVIRHA